MLYTTIRFRQLFNKARGLKKELREMGSKKTIVKEEATRAISSILMVSTTIESSVIEFRDEKNPSRIADVADAVYSDLEHTLKSLRELKGSMLKISDSIKNFKVIIEDITGIWEIRGVREELEKWSENLNNELESYEMQTENQNTIRLDNLKSHVKLLNKMNVNLDGIINKLFLDNKLENEILSLCDTHRNLINRSFSLNYIGAETLITSYFNAINYLRQDKVKKVIVDKEKMQNEFPTAKKLYLSMEGNLKASFEKYKNSKKEKDESIRKIAENISVNILEISSHDNLDEEAKLHKLKKILTDQIQEKYNKARELFELLGVLRREIDLQIPLKIHSSYKFLETEIQKMQDNVKKHMHASYIDSMEDVLEMELPHNVLRKMGFFMNSDVPIEYKAAKIFLTAYDCCLTIIQDLNIINKSHLATYKTDEVEKLMELREYEEKNITNPAQYKIEEITEEDKMEFLKILDINPNMVNGNRQTYSGRLQNQSTSQNRR